MNPQRKGELLFGFIFGHLLSYSAGVSDASYDYVVALFGSLANQTLDPVNHAVERNGKIIIPSFAVGRTQQLLYTLYNLTRTGCIPKLPVFVDSPLSLQATEVFRRHPECFNKNFYDLMMNHDNPFSTSAITYVTSVEQSMSINDMKGPCIIVSASGMAEAAGSATTSRTTSKTNATRS
jgi:predicted metal-dependent RNase